VRKVYLMHKFISRNYSPVNICITELGQGNFKSL